MNQEKKSVGAPKKYKKPVHGIFVRATENDKPKIKALEKKLLKLNEIKQFFVIKQIVGVVNQRN